MYSSYRPDKSIWKTNCSVLSPKGMPAYPEYSDESGKKYRIVCSGKMQSKKHEMLFPFRTSDHTIFLSEDTINAFYTVYENTPGFGQFKNAVEKGEEIPVFYLNDSMPVIGLSKMFRIPCRKSLKDMVRHDQQLETKQLDLCEELFGTVHGVAGKEAFKGRIQVGHAFASQSVSSERLIKVKGVLGQPNASYFPLYVKQDKNPYKTYDTGTSISGRKLYRIHKGASTTQLPQDNQNDNMANHFYALPPGITFVLRINVHNLKKVEIGALLSALNLNATKDAYHNIGMAKSFGYGKIQIEDIKLYQLSCTVNEYEQAFEKQMDAFVSKQIKSGLRWCETEQMTQLINILREHEDAVVRLMPLGNYKTEGTYGYYKEKRNFRGAEIERLTEPGGKS